MFNKKSIYALNKKEPDAIIYPDADGNIIRLTREDFANEAEFLRWKAWSDAEYKETEKAGRGYDDNTVTLIDDMDCTGETLEDELIAIADRMEHDAQCAAMVAQIRAKLTEKQFQRLWKYHVEKVPVKLIAGEENVCEHTVYVSIASAEKKIRKIFGGSAKTWSKNA